jgi:hypothetical protein
MTKTVVLLPLTLFSLMKAEVRPPVHRVCLPTTAVGHACKIPVNNRHRFDL